MSSHRRRVKHFARKSGPRKALLRGFVISLVEHGRIKTTVDRAKETQRHVERAITIGKKGDLSSHRLLLSRYPHPEAVTKIMKEIAPRMSERAGGYTRVIKIGRRPGDTAEMAFLEFVDYDYKTAATPEGSKAEVKEAKKAQAKKVKATQKLVAAKKKSYAKMQKTSRAASR